MNGHFTVLLSNSVRGMLQSVRLRMSDINRAHTKCSMTRRYFSVTLGVELP